MHNKLYSILIREFYEDMDSIMVKAIGVSNPGLTIQIYKELRVCGIAYGLKARKELSGFLLSNFISEISDCVKAYRRIITSYDAQEQLEIMYC